MIRTAGRARNRGGRRFWTPSAASILAPTAPFTAGTQVGVPVGTVLTPTSGLPGEDAVEELVLTHPVSGAQATRTVAVWRNRHWTSTANVNPGPGATYLFDRCLFENELDNFCFDLNDDDGVADLMAPLVVFRNCTFNGNDTVGSCIVGGFMWIIDCDSGHAENGWSGFYWSVAIRSNFVATTDGGVDSHSDAVQGSGIGNVLAYRCWFDAGRDALSANAAIRVGTEFSAVTNVDVRYCGLAGTQHGAQFRGDAGAGDISNVTFIGNRWVDEQVHGPVDFQQVTNVTWTDNAFIGGVSIPSPV